MGHDQADTTQSPSESWLTIDVLRETVKEKIENELQNSVFASLQKNNTESLIIYLIVISLEPVLQAYQENPVKIDALIQTVWASKYSLIEDCLLKKLNLSQLALSLEKLIEADRTAAKLLESLLLFSEVISAVEEAFHTKEWILWQLRSELGNWHKQGKFQRIEITIPSQQFSPPTMLRGDLHVRVSTSKTTVVAGQEFSVFVVVNNPFEVPIILYSVETQIPVEIVDIVEKQRRRTALVKEYNSLKLKRQKSSFSSRMIRFVVSGWEMSRKLANEPDNRIAQAVSTSEVNSSKKSIDLSFQIESIQNSEFIGAQIDKFQTLDINIDSISPQHLDSILWRFEASKRGAIPIVLQPGNSVVKQFIFRTRSWLFFTPLAHKLQIQVQYGVDERDHLYTLPFDLTIQAEIKAVMTGAVIGSCIGGIARLLSDIKSNSGVISANAGFLSILLAVILSAITVVSFARKSGVQQIVSVEDFWGGLFLGFLIGFLGQEFALNLITPNATGKVSPAPSL